MVADLEMNEHERAQDVIQGFWRRISDRRADSAGPVDDADGADGTGGPATPAAIESGTRGESDD